MINICDSVRNPVNVRNPDPRTQDHTLEWRLGYISQFVLAEDVPDEVRIHFETGRNLYVYAWYVYRFNMVAEQHILASLEMAARLCLAHFTACEPPRGLSKLLRAASTSGLIANERLINRDGWALERASYRHDLAEMERMTQEGLSECVVDYRNVQPLEDDLNFDWIEHFISALPHLRNKHAHGTDALDPAVGRTFQIVCELINQMFMPFKAKESASSD